MPVSTKILGGSGLWRGAQSGLIFVLGGVGVRLAGEEIVIALAPGGAPGVAFESASAHFWVIERKAIADHAA